MNLEFENSIIEMEKKIAELKALGNDTKVNFTAEIYELEKRLRAKREEIYENLTPWETLQVARHPSRPILQDYIALTFNDFIELHGDRAFADDRGLIGGFAGLNGKKVMLIGHNKGKSPEENNERNFGMAKPEGYRKALRLMKLAEKYGIPVVNLIDTSGAYPGKDAEERGQPEAIAKNLTEMSRIEVPIIVVVTGEGGSGGAIGIGVGDVVMMLSHAVYSVISPEGCAAILWKDAKFAPQAAEALKITAPSLEDLGIIDEIIPEPAGGAHRDHQKAASILKKTLVRQIDRLCKVPKERLIQNRFEKYSAMGRFAS